ncbi:MAG TPA: hypothetical protein VHM24_02565, partial [Gemmatimonadaceae bacterium]|nr:hypothetical protein [Gemmatimonadaceae bacterium]
LLAAARDCRDDKIGEDDVHVWWGKVRSVNRQQPITHLARILELDAELNRIQQISAMPLS